MPLITNYLVISSTPFELQDDQQRTFVFELPGGLVMGLSAARPLLAYKVKPLALRDDNARVTLAIDMNDHRLVSLQIEQTILRGMWEIFPDHFLRANSTNMLQFRVLNGSVQLADIVLWFQHR